MRRRRSPPQSCWLVLAVLAAGCRPVTPDGAETTPDVIRVIDASGVERSIPGPARRVVSLVPSATQTLRALGMDHVVVGRTDFDTDDWVADIPSVGGGIEPNLEEIVALEPDLVVRFAGEQDPRTPARLDDLGIAHVSVRPDRIDDIYASVILLGRVTGAEAAADSLVSSIEEGLAEVARSTAELPRLRSAYVLGGTPPWVAGPETYIDEVVRLAGGDNVFADLGSLYASVSPEEIRSREIDVILVTDRSQFDRTLAPNTRVEEVGEVLELPGPGVVAAARLVAELLHGVRLAGS